MRQFEGFMRGVNLGGWLSQAKLSKEHLDTFIQEHDFDTIRNMGADHVRLPIDFELIEETDGTPIEEGYEYIRRAIAWSRANDLNILLDLHKTAGYVFDDPLYSADFFANDAMKKRFLALWDRLSRFFGNDPEHIAFDLLNEVVDASVSDAWNELALQAIEVVRKNAPMTWIILGGTRSNSVVTLKELDRPYDDRIVFNFHCYEPLLFTHQGASWVAGMPTDYQIDYPLPIADYISITNQMLDPNFSYPIRHLSDLQSGKEFFRAFFAEAISISKEYNVPLYCGEYGVIDCAPHDAALRWINDIHDVFDEYGIGRAIWSYKKMNFGITGENYQGLILDSHTS